MDVNLTTISNSDKNTLQEMVYEYQRELLGKEPGEYQHLDSYWDESDRFPFFIKVGSEIAGFALVNSYTVILPRAKSIAEFYVENKYRKQGIGIEAAKQVIKLFPGKWEIRQLKGKLNARIFWLKVISELTNNDFQETIMNNKKWKGWIQTFNIK